MLWNFFDIIEQIRANPTHEKQLLLYLYAFNPYLAPYYICPHKPNRGTTQKHPKDPLFAPSYIIYQPTLGHYDIFYSAYYLSEDKIVSAPDMLKILLILTQ